MSSDTIHKLGLYAMLGMLAAAFAIGRVVKWATTQELPMPDNPWVWLIVGAVVVAIVGHLCHTVRVLFRGYRPCSRDDGREGR